METDHKLIKQAGWDLPYCIPVMLVIGFLVGGLFL